MKSVNSINALTEFLPFFLLAKPDNPTLFPFESRLSLLYEIVIRDKTAFFWQKVVC
jgi:hypothetical protein